METSKLRGHEIKLVNNEWVYCDTEKSTSSTWQNRPCGHCNLYNTLEGHDGCLGTLPDVINACCGHGNTKESYVQLEDGSTLRQTEALKWINSKQNKGIQ